MKGTITKFKVAVQTAIHNERGSYLPPRMAALPNHQDVAMLPMLAAFGDRDRGPSAASRYDMLVKSDVSAIVNSLTF